MRYNLYLNEADFGQEACLKGCQLVLKECKPFLTHFKAAGFAPLYRATRISGVFEKKAVRSDREPRDMHPDDHKALDDAAKKVFGWKIRSEGLFVTGKKFDASRYGERNYSPVGLVFPVGNFKYVWGVKARDTFESYGDFTISHNYRSLPKHQQTEVAELFFKEYNYKTSDLKAAIKSGHEIMIKCDYYYIFLEHSDFNKIIFSFFRKNL